MIMTVPLVFTKNAAGLFVPLPVNIILAGLESCIVEPSTPSSIAAISEYVVVTPDAVVEGTVTEVVVGRFSIPFQPEGPVSVVPLDIVAFTEILAEFVFVVLNITSNPVGTDTVVPDNSDV